MPSDVVLDAMPQKVTPPSGQRGSGHLVVWLSQPAMGRAQQPGLDLHVNRRREGCICASILASSASGRQPADLPGSEPHSGNPTVWDRREACGNVSYGLG